jgi:hypothetical protein
VKPKQKEVSVSDFDCCPVMEPHDNCDVLDFRYRLPFLPRIDNQKLPVEASVILHFRFERCTGSMTLGDLAYTTTLLPGERVRIYTSDRHSRWSYESESQLAYRHETTSEESYLTWSMARAMSDLTVSQSGVSSSHFDESWASGGGGAGIDLGIIEIGGGGGGGSYDASSFQSFAQNLSRHAEAMSSHVAAGVRASSSTAIGEVERRTHAEGESEAHYESASRTFTNPNRCHAITYLFYKINKVQHIRFSLVAIVPEVEDAASPTVPDRRIVPDTTGKVAVRPQAVLATSSQRLEVERMARQSALERQRAASGLGASDSLAGLKLTASRAAIGRVPLDPRVRKEALEAVKKDLAEAKLVDPKTGKPSDRIVAELSWSREETIPTPGILVKGCLDECGVCEAWLQKEIELELERKQLKNELLKRRIELLDKAQEYRCCPVGEEEED